MRTKLGYVRLTVFLVLIISTLLLPRVKAIEMRYENYSESTYTSFYEFDIHFMVQTFTTISSHNVSAVVLWLSKIGSPGLFSVSIRQTTGDGVPANLKLADCNSTDGNSLSTLATVSGVSYNY